MTEPNQDYVADPVLDDVSTGVGEEVDETQSQPISVTESEEYKRLAAEKAEIERRAREYESRLQQMQQPPPEPQAPPDDPVDALEDQRLEVSGKFHALDTWCQLNPKDPDISLARKERDTAKKQLLAIEKAIRSEQTKAHVEAVKGLATKQSERQRISDHWAKEIESDPLCQELTEEAKLDLHNKIMNGADPIKARTFVRKMLRLDPDKVTQGSLRPSLQSIPGGRSNYIPTESAGGGSLETESDAQDFNKQLAARRKKQAQDFGYGR